jgi:hypothetical protein
MHYHVIDHRSGRGFARVVGVKRAAARGSHHGRASAVTDSYRVTDSYSVTDSHCSADACARLGYAALPP